MKHRKMTIARAKKMLIGSNGNGLVQKLCIYGFVIIIGFVFIYPLLQMISDSLMSPEDIVNPLVEWIPQHIYTDNYSRALNILDYWKSLASSLYVSILPALLQMCSCSLVGYGLARFDFRGKKVIFALVLATFIIPPQVTMIPQFLMYKDLGILYSIKAYILPAIFGQGIKSAIFILVFYQFFCQLPKALEEAAKVDGAGNLRIFFKIAVPTALPAYLLTFLLSMVWYWNDTYMATMYFGTQIQTLPMKLSAFEATFKQMYPAAAGVNTGNTVNEAIKMAGTFLNILPLLIIYFFTQRWFMEGIDKSGITGE